MVIYEVNLLVKGSIFIEYRAWLKEHMVEMVNFPGFISAELSDEISEESESRKMTARYELDSMESLDNYLTNHSQAMRQDGINRFGDNFSATRRIFEVSDLFKPEKILRHEHKQSVKI